ncbi:MAG: DUF3185 domain-containing protein [Verrucomicrobiota bacterium]
MKPVGIVGILLVVLGIIVLGYGWLGSAKYTTQENVAKLGPLEINKQQEHHIPLGPIVGGVCLVGGILLLVTGSNKT